MCSKCFTKFLRKILYIIILVIVKMCSVEKKANEGCYAFKAFRFSKITPNPRSKIPIPRSGHRIGADSANFYSFGGYNPLVRDEVDQNEEDEFWIQTYPLFQELWKFNFASKQWTRYNNRETLPMELASNALVLHGNILMVYGGTGCPFGIRSSNQLYVCKVNDKDGLMVEINTTGQLPLPLYGQAVVFHNDYLYTIGGTTGLSYTCDVHRLNIKTMRWEAAYICSGRGEYEPKGRYRHEVGFDGRRIYVLGGGTSDEAYGFKFVPAFDVETKVWVKQKTLKDPVRGYPSARRCHAAAQPSGSSSVFIVGGHDGSNGFDDLWRLDLSTLRWTYVDTCRLPTPTYFHAAAATPEGRLVVFGGNRGGDVDRDRAVDLEVCRSNDVYEAWLGVPQLSEMCWEAVLFYGQRIIGERREEELIDMGLPRRFVQRLGRLDVL